MVNTENPEALLSNDPNAQVFYVLADRQVALCKKGERAVSLPYYKQRSSYISSGVVSPAQKKVCFWGDALEIETCMGLLTESGTIDDEFTYVLAGGRKMNMVGSGVTKIELRKKPVIDGIRRKGRAGFNRLPAAGINDLKPQLDITVSKPNIEQREMPNTAKPNNVSQTPSKIEIRTKGGDLQRQNVPPRPPTVGELPD